MSLGIYPVFDPHIKEARFNALGEILASDFKILDQIAEANGLAGSPHLLTIAKYRTTLTGHRRIWKT